MQSSSSETRSAPLPTGLVISVTKSWSPVAANTTTAQPRVRTMHTHHPPAVCILTFVLITSNGFAPPYAWGANGSPSEEGGLGQRGCHPGWRHRPGRRLVRGPPLRPALHGEAPCRPRRPESRLPGRRPRPGPRAPRGAQVRKARKSLNAHQRSSTAEGRRRIDQRGRRRSDRGARQRCRPQRRRPAARLGHVPGASARRLSGPTASSAYTARPGRQRYRHVHLHRRRHARIDRDPDRHVDHRCRSTIRRP